MQVRRQMLYNIIMPSHYSTHVGPRPHFHMVHSEPPCERNGPGLLASRRRRTTGGAAGVPCERHPHKSSADMDEPEERERGGDVAGGERRGEVTQYICPESRS